MGMMTLTPEQTVDALEIELGRLVGAVETSDLDAGVPNCPPWTVGVLAGHIGGSHRWAAEVVRRLPQDVLRPGPAQPPAGAKATAKWLDEGGRALVDALRVAEADAPVWTWAGDRRVRWWARRQLHETAVHRADLWSAFGGDRQDGETAGGDARADEVAGGDAGVGDWSVEDAVAADGVEEFLGNLPYTRIWAPQVEKLRG
ncbi:MAG: maleylpyruvate isomerase N-terminal domain-containing protein, partial [Stackebrandtia sp.]